jgi:deoxyadenosine/deoxycytidine kinase
VPDLVVFLQASTEVLMQRIARRDREYERDMSRDYIEELIEAYNHFFFHYSESPLLIVNTNELDFVHRGEEYEDLKTRITEGFQGVRYYQPSWER